MPSSTVDNHLGEWLEPATVDLSSGQHAQWRTAVATMSAKLIDSLMCIQLVAAAHGDMSDSARGWISDRLREQEPAFSGTGKDLLLTLLAGAAVVETLETPTHAKRVLVALLVDSARCTLPAPQVAAVRAAAQQVGNEVRRSVRKRALDQKPVLKEVSDQLAAVTQLDPAAGDWAVASGVLTAHDAVLRRIAERLDETTKQVLDVVRLQDEELDTLWWSYGGLSITTGAPWGTVMPPEHRAVLASVELRRLLTRTPSPASSRSLLARILGDVCDSQATLAAVAGSTVDYLDDFAGLPDHRLLPLASAARERQRLGDGDDTWKTVVSRTLGFDVETKLSLLDAAEQVLRELDVKALY